MNENSQKKLKCHNLPIYKNTKFDHFSTQFQRTNSFPFICAHFTYILNFMKIGLNEIVCSRDEIKLYFENMALPLVNFALNIHVVMLHSF